MPFISESAIGDLNRNKEKKKRLFVMRTNLISSCACGYKFESKKKNKAHFGHEILSPAAFFASRANREWVLGREACNPARSLSICKRATPGRVEWDCRRQQVRPFTKEKKTFLKNERERENSAQYVSAHLIGNFISMLWSRPWFFCFLMVMFSY